MTLQRHPALDGEIMGARLSILSLSSEGEQTFIGARRGQGGGSVVVRQLGMLGREEEDFVETEADPSSKWEAIFSSATCEWPTPRALFDVLDEEFGFELDVCAGAENAKCSRYFTIEDDGLRQTWSGVCWCNPPYGRDIGRWVHKARVSAAAGATVVMLLPARTDTRWWHEDVQPFGEARFIRGRVRFGDAKAGAPFPSVLVVFRPRAPEATT